MLQIKISVLILCLVFAAIVGAVSLYMVQNLFYPKPTQSYCRPCEPVDTFRRAEIIQTGRDKGY